jgi:hypothetical protein
MTHTTSGNSRPAATTRTGGQPATIRPVHAVVVIGQTVYVGTADPTRRT